MAMFKTYLIHTYLATIDKSILKLIFSPNEVQVRATNTQVTKFPAAILPYSRELDCDRATICVPTGS